MVPAVSLILTFVMTRRIAILQNFEGNLIKKK